MPILAADVTKPWKMQVGQKASVSNTENIEIVRENWGFDLEKGITTVDMNLTQEHYFLEVTKRSMDK